VKICGQVITFPSVTW